MSSRALMAFTDRPDFSSAGVSRMNSIGRCDPVPYDSGEQEEWIPSHCWFRFPVCEHADGMQAFFDMCVPGENGTFSLSQAETYRLLCHSLVQHLPETAFGEAVEALTGMYDFYRYSTAIPAPALPHSVKARVTANYTAPVFPVLEE